METVEFIKMRDQLVELFPTEEKDIFYIPAYRNEEKEAIAARGCLYNSYKFVRKQLRIAGIITNEVPDTFVSKDIWQHWKNLIVTIATKQILQMCHMKHNLECASNLKYGSYDARDCNAIYIINFVTHDKIECYNYIEICNTLYAIGSFIVTNMEKKQIEFGEIIKIVKDKMIFISI